ncbi:MAG TPA: type I restriction enzyme HsdR N-terminal domain-containing protein [Fibrobacteraceae bacterium]|nr:type I restriction enzyme HsdR N-terminal domain-containing protein [Fibrobacteraceae bacterium]
MEKIPDPIRRKEVAATPEEKVRQDLVRWLIEEKAVPQHLIEVECALGKIHPGAPGRVDVLVHGFRQGKSIHHPWLLVECKRPGETDWARLEVQVNRYLRYLTPNYLLLQIGEERHILRLEPTRDGKINTTAINDLPSMSQPN